MDRPFMIALVAVVGIVALVGIISLNDGALPSENLAGEGSWGGDCEGVCDNAVGGATSAECSSFCSKAGRCGTENECDRACDRSFNTAREKSLCKDGDTARKRPSLCDRKSGMGCSGDGERVRGGV